MLEPLICSTVEEAKIHTDNWERITDAANTRG